MYGSIISLDPVKLILLFLLPILPSTFLGLLGFHPDLLLEILSEQLISDLIQFLCVSQRIEIINKDPADIELVDIDCVQMKIIKKKIAFVTTILTQVLAD
ncbi:MAG: hypothetical protein EZS28_039882 [Streblomastix strix]|uniref:Uncharacterized protein n=1 Tax=Streblomastix strix TaxID=222440 RepID=A0A5J4U3K8_9EUKA|nr:MAG: hypothetical protein EZS28_039882 [Streblomastix strix]